MSHSATCQSVLLMLAMLPLACITHPAHASEALHTEPTATQLANATEAAGMHARSAGSAQLTTQAASKVTGAKSVTTRVAKHASKTLTKKIFLPLRISLAELSHPVELLKSAQRHIWPGNADTQIIDDSSAQPVRVGRVFDVGLNPVATYRLTDSTTRLLTQDRSLDRFGVPGKYVSSESASRISATQLQVRMSDEWSLLYELDRLDSDIGADKLSLGLGLRHAF